MKKIFTKNNPILIIILLSVIPLLIIYYYFRGDADMIKKQKESELSVISSLKEDQIEIWLKERIADAMLFRDSPLFLKEAQLLIENPDNLNQHQKMIYRIGLTKQYYKYENIIITDLNGNKVISAVPMSANLPEFTKNKLKETKNKNDIQISDFFYCDDCKKVIANIIVPLMDKNNKIFGFTVMNINPEDFLFPILAKWPVTSKTSESVLIQKTKDSVVFCNALRQIKNVPLKFRLSLKSNDILAVKAAKGLKGVFFAKDYRGVNVLGDIRHINGTNWYMINKIDLDELYSEIMFRKNITIMLLISVIVIVTLLTFVIYNRRRRKLYEKLLKSETEKNRLEKEFRTTLYSIGDAVLLADNAGNVTNMNAIAEAMTGWKESEAIGRQVEEVFKIINEETKNKVENPVKRVLSEGIIVGLANHTVLVSKDGKETPIADSGAPVRNMDGEITGVVLVCRDQTEERTIIRNLAESRRRFQSLFASTNDGIALHELIFDSNGKPYDYRILEVNSKYSEMTRIPSDKATGALARELYGTGEAPYLERYAEVAMTGRSITFESFFEPMQKYFYISVFSPGFNQFATVFQDITERKMIEIKLKESEFFFKESQNAAEIGSYRTDFVKGFWESSEALDKIFGIGPDYIRSIIGWLEIIHPDDKKMMNDYLHYEVIGNKNKFDKEYRIVRINDKQVRWVHGLGITEFDGNGNILSMTGTIQDITEKKRIQDEIKHSEEKYRLLLENSGIGVGVFSVDGIIELFNQKAVQNMGGNISDYIGKSVIEVFGEKNGKEYIRRFYETTKSDKSIDYEDYVETTSGKYWFLSNHTSIKNSLGEIKGVQVLSHDITERKKFETELRNAKEKAEENDKLKTAFLQNISHEVRTPLNAIMGFANLLDDESITEKEKQHFTTIIKSSCNQLLNIISDIINISLIESGQAKISDKETDVKNILNNLFLQYEKNIDVNNIKFNMKLEEDEEEYLKIITDDIKLTQILTNLLSNAVKFTKQGKIEFGCSIKNSMLKFFVKDTGIGIADDKHPMVFDRFWQADTAMHRQYQGMGLGLAISKAYVEMLGGQIWFESKPGVGSEFFFTIPYKPTKFLDEKKVESDSAKINGVSNGKSILVVEDEMYNFLLIKALLTKYNVKLIHAMNGLEGVNYCKENPDIDLVLMDVRLPVMDGIEATAHIKKFRPKLPVIVLTAYALKSDEERIMQSGCDAYLTKPLSSMKLFEVINKLNKN